LKRLIIPVVLLSASFLYSSKTRAAEPICQIPEKNLSHPELQENEVWLRDVPVASVKYLENWTLDSNTPDDPADLGLLRRDNTVFRLTFKKKGRHVNLLDRSQRLGKTFVSSEGKKLRPAFIPKSLYCLRKS